MAAEEGEAAKNPPIPPKRSSTNSAMEMKESILSPGFRSAAAMAGWDEEAVLASLVVEDTPVRESGKHKKRHTHHHLKSPPTTNSNRKRRSRRRSPGLVPPVVLCLDDDEEAIKEDVASAKSKEMGTIAADEEKNNKGERASPEKATSKGLPCMDRLREELSCAICLEICYEPSTTPCGHSFCRKCLKCAASRCGRRCPKCRQLISNGRSCTVNTVLWNTIQLLFPEEVEVRKSATATTPQNSKVFSQSPERSNSNSRVTSANTNTRIGYTRRATYVSQAIEIERRSSRRNTVPSQSEDAALAYRLQREEFMEAFQGTRAHQRHVLNAARANLRAMASRAIQIRSRGRPT